MKRVIKITIVWMITLMLFISDSFLGQTKIGVLENNLPNKTELFRSDMRKLCEEHIMWTRSLILCIVDSLPGREQTEKRLLQNLTDIYTYLKPYYGEEKSNTFYDLLKTHIILMCKVVKYARVNDTKMFNLLSNKLFQNSEEISLFLNKTNPNWALTEMKMMMSEHIQLTMEEAKQRIVKDYETDIITYDKLHNEILEVSDMLADDIIRQFPSKFQTVAITKPVSR